MNEISSLHAIQGGFNFWVYGWNPKVHVTIQMIATEKYSVTRGTFIMSYKVVRTKAQMKFLITTIQMKATEQNVPLVPFIETMNVVPTV